MAGALIENESEHSMDDDSFIDLYAHIEESTRRLERRLSRESYPGLETTQGLELRARRRASADACFSSLEKPRGISTRKLSSNSNDCEKPKSQTRRKSSDQPAGVLGSFLAFENSKSNSSSSKGNRSTCSAPALASPRSSAVNDSCSVGSVKATKESLRSAEEGSSRHSSRSKSRSRSTSCSRGQSSRNQNETSKGDLLSRREGVSTRQMQVPKDAESLVASKLREIRKGQDEQRRKSQELKRSMSQRQAYRSLQRSQSTSRSSRNLTRQNSNGSLSKAYGSTRSNTVTRNSSTSPKPTSKSQYLNTLFV